MGPRAVKVSITKAGQQGPGEDQRRKTPVNKTRFTRNLKRTLSTLVVSVGLTLVANAAPAAAGGTWAG